MLFLRVLDGEARRRFNGEILIVDSMVILIVEVEFAIWRES